MLSAGLGQIYREYHLWRFMTTRYTPPYPHHLLAWPIVKFPLALLRIRQLVRHCRIDLARMNETTLVACALGVRLFSPQIFMALARASASRKNGNWIGWIIQRLVAGRVVAYTALLMGILRFGARESAPFI